MKKKFKKIFRVIIILLMPLALFSQIKQKWLIYKVINTHLELGAPNSSIDDFCNQKNLYEGKFIYIQDNRLFFPKSLKKSNSYSDTVLIENAKTFNKHEDDEISFRYPGDELNCLPKKIKKNECFVGESFMKLLGNKDSKLTFYELKGNYPNYYSYKLCIIKENKKLGLLLENSSVLLLLENRK